MPRKAASVVKEKASKVVKKLPASECGTGVLCTTMSGKQYQIIQNPEKKNIRYGVLWMTDMRKLRLGIRPMIYTP